jgi:taurine dioxygenase
MDYDVRRLSSVLGAEISGVNVAEVGDNLFNELHQVWLAHNGVLIFRDQELTPEQHLAFSRRFGTLLPHNIPAFEYPGLPELFHFRIDEVPAEVPLDRSIRNGSGWHAAHTYENELSGASLTHAIEIAPRGGDMFFANMTAAYDALSAPFKRMLGELRAIHRRTGDLGHKDGGEVWAEHPVVYTHPESGRKALLVNPSFTAEIVGLSADESKAILGFLFQHATRPEFTYRHNWRRNDLLVWDDRCNIHYHLTDYTGGGRVVLNRTSASAAGRA